jgi:hypothetical protein
MSTLIPPGSSTTNDAPSTLETEVKLVATRMLHEMKRTDAVEPFSQLLDKLGALPPWPEDERQDKAAYAAVEVKRIEIEGSMFDRVCSYLLKSGSLATAIMHALPDHLEVTGPPKGAGAQVAEGIRTFFMHPRPEYTYDDLRLLFSDSLVGRAVDLNCLQNTELSQARMSWRDVGMAVTIEYPASVIEDALGDEADRLLPQEYRTEIVRLRLPKHAINELKRRAKESERYDINTIVENEFCAGGYLPEREFENVLSDRVIS